MDVGVLKEQPRQSNGLLMGLWCPHLPDLGYAHGAGYAGLTLRSLPRCWLSFFLPAVGSQERGSPSVFPSKGCGCEVAHIPLCQSPPRR